MTPTKTLLVVLSLSLVQIAWTQLSDSDAAIAAGKACYDGFIRNIPPAFCYKKGADAGTIPTSCSSGYFRSLALCYENCDGNFVLGVCWRRCKDGFSDHGATCYKSIINWYWKSSYIPGSYTNFDSRVGCESGKYKEGALCYRDCGKIGLTNCGIGACASSTSTCVKTIVTMAADVAMSLAKTISFVASFGTSSAATMTTSSVAKSALQTGLKQLGKEAVKTAANAVKSIISKQGLANYIKKITQDANSNIKKYATGDIAMSVLTTACETVGNQVFKKINSVDDVVVDLQTFSPTISSITNNCKGVSSKTDNDKLACAKAVMSACEFADPTGIVGMATAVMQPTCDGV